MWPEGGVHVQRELCSKMGTKGEGVRVQGVISSLGRNMGENMMVQLGASIHGLCVQLGG